MCANSLDVCAYPVFIIVMGEGEVIPFYCNSSSIKMLGMVEYTQESIILLNGVISLRIGISIS